MLVGMPAPRDLHRSEVDGQVFVAVGATVLFSYAADDAGLRNLAAVQVAWRGHAHQHGLHRRPDRHPTIVSSLNTFRRDTPSTNTQVKALQHGYLRRSESRSRRSRQLRPVRTSRAATWPTR